MRTMLTFSLMLATIPVLAAERRTWTIATQVETREAELIAVRGDVVYLKVGEQIQEVPLERLSAADHKYLASLALAPLLPGPADEEDLGLVSPLTREEPEVVQAAGMSGPALVPPGGPVAPASATEEDELLPIPAGQSVAPPPSGARPTPRLRPAPTGAEPYRATSANRRTADEDDTRRARRVQQSQNAANRSNSQRNSEPRRRGLFFRRGG